MEDLREEYILKLLEFEKSKLKLYKGKNKIRRIDNEIKIIDDSIEHFKEMQQLKKITNTYNSISIKDIKQKIIIADKRYFDNGIFSVTLVEKEKIKTILKEIYNILEKDNNYGEKAYSGLEVYTIIKKIEKELIGE